MNVDLILGEVLVMFSMHTLTPLFSVTKLVNAAYYQLGPDFKWPGERHDFWEVVYVDRGEAVITAGEEEYPLKAGEMVFHCPNEWHNLRAAEGKTAGVVIIAFVCDSLSMEAFRRRIGFMVHFTLPDEAQRLRLWKNAFPDGAPVQQLDWELLAGQLELSGAGIRSCAVHAACLAAAEQKTITMGRVIRAARREYEKEGRTFPPRLDVLEPPERSEV